MANSNYKENYKELDLAELEREFNSEYGDGSELDKEDLKCQNQDDKILEEAVLDMVNAYMKESVKHLKSSRTGDINDEARYFMNLSELEVFKSLFTKEGGDLDTLHIGRVNNPDTGNLLSYEVCRKKYYDKDVTHSVFFS